ncbi:MAG TPA: hypothetical protein VHU77_11355 [Candidatus Limnocylindria bacterium]|jgi:hypothetical protein|nr:hypothetical protein [Candidatus Limnocylindria bacterium]
MGTKQLKALLRTLNAAGVLSYTDGAVSVTFGGPIAPVVDKEDATGAGELSLPPGTPDPGALIRQLYAEREAAKKAKRS